MKKYFDLENIDCAVCAQKVEDAVKKIPGVMNASVNFLTEKIMLELADDLNEKDLLKQIKKTIKSIEPDCEVNF